MLDRRPGRIGGGDRQAGAAAERETQPFRQREWRACAPEVGSDLGIRLGDLTTVSPNDARSRPTTSAGAPYCRAFRSTSDQFAAPMKPSINIGSASSAISSSRIFDPQLAANAGRDDDSTLGSHRNDDRVTRWAAGSRRGGDSLCHLDCEAAARNEGDRLSRRKPGRLLPVAHVSEGPQPRLAGQRKVQIEEGALLTPLAR